MRRSRPIRDDVWSEIPESARLLVTRKKCAICKAKYGKLVVVDGKVYLAKQVIHHLLSRRFLEGRGINPHRVGNLLSICQRDHGKTQGFEACLFRGDVLGFLQGCNRIGLPIDKIVRFAVSVGLNEFQGVRV